MEDNRNSPTRELFLAAEHILDFYTGDACPCSFPRFIQVVSLDCMDMDLLFTCRETEAFLKLCRERDLYSVEDIDADFQSDTEYWTCNTCGSRFLWGWSDTSVKIDRQYLKPVIIRAEKIGAGAANPIPLFGGFFGKNPPSDKMWIQVGSEDMIKYFVQMK